MPLLTTGISHHTATLEIREKIAIARTDYAARVKELNELDGVEEVVVVSTCNRTEIYSIGPKQSGEQVRQWLQAKGDLSDAEMEERTVMFANANMRCVTFSGLQVDWNPWYWANRKS